MKIKRVFFDFGKNDQGEVGEAKYSRIYSRT